MHFWVMAPMAILILVAVDLSSQRFDPVFETIPGAVGTALFTMAALAVLIAIFFATYSFPAEVESRVAYTVTTKPVGPTELVAGKVVGVSVLLLGMLTAVSAGAYVYFLARGSAVRALAAERRAEAAPRARHSVDLNALDAVVRLGPLRTYRYCPADAGPQIEIHHPSEAPAAPGVQWVLGESGARLRWNLTDTPIREWVRLYVSLDQAAASTEALRAALRLGAQADRAGDEPAAREAYTAAAQRLQEAAADWDRAARLWEAWVGSWSAHPPPAPAVSRYQETAQAAVHAAEIFADLSESVAPENMAEVVSRLPAVTPPAWKCLLVLDTEVRPPPEQPDQPTAMTIRVVPLAPGAGSAEEEEEKGLATTVQQSGSQTQTVPLLLPGTPAEAGALRLPFNIDILIEVRARGPGPLVGAREGGLRLVGPGGETVTVSGGPAVEAELFRRRPWIYGRAREPRQVAIFRFNDVPPDILGREETAVEAGFTVAAWSATGVETTAQVTFVNPATGEERVLRFTPETQHSALLYLDRAFWNGGPLEARLECLSDGDSFGLIGESLRLRLDGGPFFWNFLKAMLRVWLFGTVLASAGILLSLRLSWFVSIFAAITVFILGMSRGFILQATPVGQAADLLARQAADAPVRVWIARHLIPPIPDLRAMLPPETVTLGEAFPLSDLGMTLVWAAAFVVAVILAGGYLLKTREVAA